MLQNIFLVALSYNINIKEFGLNPVLEVIVTLAEKFLQNITKK